MAAISVEEERDRDWDWYAVDTTGHIGHFTSAGLRTLPPNVKQDREGSLRLIEFFESLPPTSQVEIASGEKVKKDLAQAGDNERRLRSFVAAASRGLYSFDTDMMVAEYFLLAVPETPLHIDVLPVDIRQVLRTRSHGVFAESFIVSEKTTLGW